MNLAAVLLVDDMTDRWPGSIRRRKCFFRTLGLEGRAGQGTHRHVVGHRAMVPILVSNRLRFDGLGTERAAGDRHAVESS
jgi:hypothetical protein